MGRPESRQGGHGQDRGGASTPTPVISSALDYKKFLDQRKQMIQLQVESAQRTAQQQQSGGEQRPQSRGSHSRPQTPNNHHGAPGQQHPAQQHEGWVHLMHQQHGHQSHGGHGSGVVPPLEQPGAPKPLGTGSSFLARHRRVSSNQGSGSGQGQQHQQQHQTQNGDRDRSAEDIIIAVSSPRGGGGGGFDTGDG